MFATLRARAREALVVGDAGQSRSLSPAARSASASARAPIFAGEDVELGAGVQPFPRGATRFRAAGAGRAQCRQRAGGDRRLPRAWRAARRDGRRRWRASAASAGASRRWAQRGGVEVVDDFAHNADKIAAAIRTAKLRAQRVLAIYQPHGYGPTRFLRRDFVATFARELGPKIAYGCSKYSTPAARPRAISRPPTSWPRSPRAAQRPNSPPSREWLIARIAEEARPGDLVLVMGARDPSLTELARAILAALEQTKRGGQCALDQLPNRPEMALPNAAIGSPRLSWTAAVFGLGKPPGGRLRRRREAGRGACRTAPGHRVVESVDIGIGPHLPRSSSHDGEIGEMHRHRPAELHRCCCPLSSIVYTCSADQPLSSASSSAARRSGWCTRMQPWLRVRTVSTNSVALQRVVHVDGVPIREIELELAEHVVAVPAPG